jgi:hypothetical protein
MYARNRQLPLCVYSVGCLLQAKKGGPSLSIPLSHGLSAPVVEGVVEGTELTIHLVLYTITGNKSKPRPWLEEKNS